MKKMAPQNGLLLLSLFSCLLWTAEGAGGNCWATPLILSKKCQSNTAVMGSRGYTVTYNITPLTDGETLVCCEGLGFDGNQNRRWFGLGCSKDQVWGKVTWGLVSGTPTVRCKTLGGKGIMVTWTH